MVQQVQAHGRARHMLCSLTNSGAGAGAALANNKHQSRTYHMPHASSSFPTHLRHGPFSYWAQLQLLPAQKGRWHRPAMTHAAAGIHRRGPPALGWAAPELAPAAATAGPPAPKPAAGAVPAAARAQWTALEAPKPGHGAAVQRPRPLAPRRPAGPPPPLRPSPPLPLLPTARARHPPLRCTRRRRVGPRRPAPGALLLLRLPCQRRLHRWLLAVVWCLAARARAPP